MSSAMMFRRFAVLAALTAAISLALASSALAALVYYYGSGTLFVWTAPSSGAQSNYYYLNETAAFASTQAHSNTSCSNCTMEIDLIKSGSIVLTRTGNDTVSWNSGGPYYLRAADCINITGGYFYMNCQLKNNQ
jgi:hypothetical protein